MLVLFVVFDVLLVLITKQIFIKKIKKPEVLDLWSTNQFDVASIGLEYGVRVSNEYTSWHGFAETTTGTRSVTEHASRRMSVCMNP